MRTPQSPNHFTEPRIPGAPRKEGPNSRCGKFGNGRKIDFDRFMSEVRRELFKLIEKREKEEKKEKELINALANIRLERKIRIKKHIKKNRKRPASLEPIN